VVLAGPTGGGKSAIALGLAEYTPAVIINADAMQVYAELSVLTARPGADACRRAVHRLYGVLGAHERCSAGRWLDLACAEIRRAWADDRLPVVVGGTGLYLKALMTGLSAIPPIPDAVRERVRTLAEEEGANGLRAALARLDPEQAGRHGRLDRQRLARALEVMLATGRPLAVWQRDAPPRPRLDARFVTVAVLPRPPVLADLIDARFDRMMAEGALDEVRALLALGLDRELPAMKAVGVRELRAYLLGEATLSSAAARAKKATRMLAKRQRTWFRHQLRADLVLDRPGAPSACATVASFVGRVVLTPRDGASRLPASSVPPRSSSPGRAFRPTEDFSTNGNDTTQE
jgi:tRNA dimethylallyltransferase